MIVHPGRRPVRSSDYTFSGRTCADRSNPCIYCYGSCSWKAQSTKGNKRKEGIMDLYALIKVFCSHNNVLIKLILIPMFIYILLNQEVKNSVNIIYNIYIKWKTKYIHLYTPDQQISSVTLKYYWDTFIVFVNIVIF